MKKELAEQIAELYRDTTKFTYHYVKNKILFDEVYNIIHESTPDKGKILDLGCGVGIVCNILSALGSGRELVGVDWDERRIAMAKQAAIENPKIGYSSGNAVDFSFTEKYDTIIILDVLHYMTTEEQYGVLERAAGALKKGGRLLIRDGDRKYPLRHFFTYLEEKIAITIAFTRGARINFLHSDRVIKFLEEQGMNARVRPMWGKTPFSNIFIEAEKI